MKMVSQLTRQAMSRHRLLSSFPVPDSFIAPPPDPPAVPAEPQAVRPLYAQIVPAEPALPPAPQKPALSRPTILPVPAQPKTLYSELMKKHDRFTERHLTGK